MAKDKITEYDATAANNTDVGGVNLAENSMNPSDVNNAIREVLSHQKEAFGSGTPLFVDQTNNRVGVNKTPTVALDVSGQAIITTADNSSTLTLTSTDADASRGAILAINRNSASPADNDIAGTIKFNAKNDASEDIELFEINTTITDASDGTEDAKMTINGIIGGASTNRLNLTNSETVFNDDGVNLDFRVEANNISNMFLVDGTNQKVKVKTSSQVSTSSAETFAVDAGTLGGYAGVFSTQTAGGFACLFLKTNSDVSNFIYFMRDTSIVGSISTNGSSTSFNTSSDYRLKENVTYDFDATSRLKQLKPCRFNFIGQKQTVDGFLAHEVTAVPEAITGEKDAMTEEVLYVDGDEIPEGKKVGDVKEASKIAPQAIDQSKLVPLLVKTIQELEARITALESA